MLSLIFFLSVSVCCKEDERFPRVIAVLKLFALYKIIISAEEAYAVLNLPYLEAAGSSK